MRKEKLPKIRKVYVYRKTKTTLDRLKIGDVFSVEPIDSSDKWPECANYLMVATGNPEADPDRPKNKGYFQITAFNLIKTENFERSFK